ncbi:MAG: DUF485 domain-containing protein [Desulfomonilaceae bacterium]
MTEEHRTDWAQVARDPKFVELRRRKERFLFGWWIISTVIFIIFLVCSILATKVFALRVIGDINVGYLLILLLFIYCWFIAGYYAWWANKVSDPLTTGLLAEFREGGTQK